MNPQPTHKAETPLSDAHFAELDATKEFDWCSRYKHAQGFARTLERQLTQLTEERDGLKLYNDAAERGIGRLWANLEAVGYIPCNNGWGDESARALSDLKEDMMEGKW